MIFNYFFDWLYTEFIVKTVISTRLAARHHLYFIEVTGDFVK